MLDSEVLQDLGKYIFRFKNIFWAAIPFLGYIFMRNNNFSYKHTLIGFLFGLVIVPLAGGVFYFFNNYSFVGFFLFYFIFVLILQQNDFSIYKSIVYAFAGVVMLLIFLYFHFIPFALFDVCEKNIYKILIILGIFYGIFYAFVGYIFDRRF